MKDDKAEKIRADIEGHYADIARYHRAIKLNADRILSAGRLALLLEQRLDNLESKR